MTDTSRKTPAIVDPKMIDTLFRKRDDLLAERADIRAKRSALARRDREIDGELADVQAAGRVFNIEVPLPKDDEDEGQRNLWLYHQVTPRPPRPSTFAGGGPALPDLQKTAGAKAVATKAEMPRVSDLVLDRLKVAGKVGSKAAPIQRYIETTYNTKIHDKTVGMTLYRLQQQKLVRRRGHTWFIAQEAMNPGVAAPGSHQPDSQER